MYELLKIYKTELLLRKLILRHIRWRGFTVHFILIIILFFGSIGLCIVMDKQIYLLAMLLLIPIVKHFAKKLEAEVKFVQKQYHSGQNYHEIRIQRLRKYLREHGLDYNKERLKLLIDQINSNSNDLKIPFLIGGSLLIATIIPIWNQILAWIFKEINRLETLVVFVLVLLFVIIAIWYIISLFKQLIYDEFIYSDFNRVKLIVSDLNEIYMKNNW